jgi:hypothetical protein
MQHVAFDPQIQSPTPIAKPGSVHINPVNGDVYQYLQADGDVEAGGLTQIAVDGSYEAKETTTTLVDGKVWQIGIFGIDVDDENYAWAWRGNLLGGTFEAKVANGTSANSVLTSTANAGEAGAGGTPIDGAINIDAGSNTALVTIYAHGILSVGKTAAFD